MADKDKKSNNFNMPLLAVAPMMAWTDRHCRYLHRVITRHALLYTEMVTDRAVLHGDLDRLLGHDPAEHPVALQLGGSDPALLGRAARVAADWGFDEINLNCGCPSDRVKSGCFGAVLMENPDLVASCAASMIGGAGGVPVTVKCRIGVDEQEPREILPRFLETVSAAGVTHFIIHARKAWLQGLSPKQNREIPPLDHELVIDMKRAFPHLKISINGGIQTLDEVETFLSRGIDGVMIGRAAYFHPMEILGEADRRLWGDGESQDDFAVVQKMLPYIEAHLVQGGQLHQVTRHMLGLFSGRPGALGWRRVLSVEGHRPGAGPEVVLAALERLRRGGKA